MRNTTENARDKYIETELKIRMKEYNQSKDAVRVGQNITPYR